MKMDIQINMSVATDGLVDEDVPAFKVIVENYIRHAIKTGLYTGEACICEFGRFRFQSPSEIIITE